MVVRTLAALGHSHGYAIAERLQQLSKGAIQLNMDTLDPGLMRLEQRGFISGEWGMTSTNRRARFCALTAAGRRQLTREKVEWDRMVSIVDRLFEGQG